MRAFPLLLAILLLLFYFPLSNFCTISVGFLCPFFFLCHLSIRHLVKNLLALLAAYLLAEEGNVSDDLLLSAFIFSNIVVVAFALLFKIKVMGASAGIFSMIGAAIPMLARFFDPFLLLLLIGASIIFESSAAVSPWSKLFHLIGFLVGVSIGVTKLAKKVYKYEEIGKAYLRYY